MEVRVSHSSRGIALVLALMVLLSLAGLGVVAVRASFEGVRLTSNFRMDRTAYRVARTSTHSVVSRAARDPLGFTSLGFAKGNQLTMDDLSDIKTRVWDKGSKGSLAVKGATASKWAPWFRVVMQTPKQLPFFPGSSVGDFCAQKHLWRIYGRIGSKPSAHEGVDFSPRWGEKAFLVHAYVGPINCKGQ